MKRKKGNANKLTVARELISSAEVYSIILRGVTSAMGCLFKYHCFSDNIEALMKFINSKKIISTEEYKGLLTQARDFYPVVICAQAIEIIKAETVNFKEKDLSEDRKKVLYFRLQDALIDFFTDWLCQYELDPLLFYRLALSYEREFSIGLYIKSQTTALSEIEHNVLRAQVIDILVLYIIEEIAIHLGMAGMDYIDCYKVLPERKRQNFMDFDEDCIDTVATKLQKTL